MGAGIPCSPSLASLHTPALGVGGVLGSSPLPIAHPRTKHGRLTPWGEQADRQTDGRTASPGASPSIPGPIFSHGPTTAHALGMARFGDTAVRSEPFTPPPEVRAGAARCQPPAAPVGAGLCATRPPPAAASWGSDVGRASPARAPELILMLPTASAFRISVSEAGFQFNERRLSAGGRR